MSKQTPLTGILCDDRIRSTGPISFARFMELLPSIIREHGYYTSARAKLGAAGDFYTSAHVAPVFARILGQHLERHWTAMQRPDPFDWVELGAADGQLAAELLPWVRQRSPDFFACLRYTAVERSLSLRRRLEENLEIYGPKVKASAKLPEGPSGSHNGQSFQGLIFANEFFDALPVHFAGMAPRSMAGTPDNLRGWQTDVESRRTQPASPREPSRFPLRSRPKSQKPRGGLACAEICPPRRRVSIENCRKT